MERRIDLKANKNYSKILFGTSTAVKVEKGATVNCLVPNCMNKKIVGGNPIHFFPVPQGNEGLAWKVAVNSNRSQHDKKIGILKRVIPPTNLYCCELHFNLETDSIVTIDEKGTAECTIKRGACPSIKATRSKRLWEIMGGKKSEQSTGLDHDDFENDSMDQSVDDIDEVEVMAVTKREQSIELDFDKFDDDSLQSVKDNDEVKHKPKPPVRPKPKSTVKRKPKPPVKPKPKPAVKPNSDPIPSVRKIYFNKDLISLVDMSKLVCKCFEDSPSPHNVNLESNGLDDQTDVKFKPMMPLTVELMKRKSLYYMGLEQSLFYRLLHIANSTTSVMHDTLVEMKIMLGLRKQRLNEEFEVLGDLFDIDKTAAEQYYSETKNLIAQLYECSLASHGLRPVSTHNKIDPLQTMDDQLDYDDDDSSESEITKYKYKVRAETDSDVVTDDFNDYESTDDSDDSNRHWTRERAECPHCKQLISECQLDSHIKNVHLYPLHLNKTLCGLCFEQFGTHKLLLEHQTESHDGASCICDVCQKMFSLFSGLREHMRAVHSKERPFLCHLCGATYFSSSKLRAHTKRVHLKVRSYACQLCDKKYYQDNSLRCHIRSVHTKQRPLKCRFGCGKSFSRFSSRHTHEQMHKVKYSCEYCSKVFSFKHNLLTHCKKIHGRNVIDAEKCKIEMKQ